jgi:hypothetical protein
MKLALLSFAGAVFLSSITADATTTYHHVLLRGGIDDDMEEYKTNQSSRNLTFHSDDDVKMCQIDQLSPAMFHTETVKKSRVKRLLQEGYKEGRCALYCDTLCTEEEECILENGKGKCIRQCQPPSLCPQGTTCQCSCVDTRRTRFLTFAAPTNQKVPMCLLEQTSPTKFRTARVQKRQVQAYLDQGAKRGSCDKHCGELCPGKSCRLATGDCAPLPADTTLCTGAKSCPEDMNECVCSCLTKGYTSPCGSSCNDNNACTEDSCDTTTGTCLHTPKNCNIAGQACDPNDGKCYQADTVIPCVAIMDEWDEYGQTEMDKMWELFRDTYPTRPFCLIVPERTFDSM